MTRSAQFFHFPTFEPHFFCCFARVWSTKLGRLRVRLAYPDLDPLPKTPGVVVGVGFFGPLRFPPLLGATSSLCCSRTPSAAAPTLLLLPRCGAQSQRNGQHVRQPLHDPAAGHPTTFFRRKPPAHTCKLPGAIYELLRIGNITRTSSNHPRT